MPSDACRTGSDVCMERRFARALSCLGARCCTNTMANPGLGGRACSSWLKASSPPADAPIPTTAMRGVAGGGAGSSPPAAGAGARGGLGFFRRLVLEEILEVLGCRDLAIWDYPPWADC